MIANQHQHQHHQQQPAWLCFVVHSRRVSNLVVFVVLLLQKGWPLTKSQLNARNFAFVNSLSEELQQDLVSVRAQRNFC